MLTSDDIQKLCMQELLGKPSGIEGEESKKFLENFRRDIKIANDNGWTIELPFEIPDSSSDDIDLSEAGDWEYYTEDTDEPPGYNVYRRLGEKVQMFDLNSWSWKNIEK